MSEILSAQCPDGGWTLLGEASDVDMTAMALTSLSPYLENRDVQAAVERALTCLSRVQQDNGGFMSWGTVNSESCAQVIVALTSLGIDPAADSRFIKNGASPLDGLCAFACVGGGSNAIGSFYNFINDKTVRLIGCEAAGRGIDTFETAATINTGRLGIFHGMKSYFCQDEYGQIAPVYSISAGLDYPGIGPEHAWLHDIGRAEYVAITDDEAVNAFEYLARTEGIIPAIESAHAVAHAIRLAPTMDKEQIIVITISGRGDKDCAAIARYRGEDLHE